MFHLQGYMVYKEDQLHTSALSFCAHISVFQNSVRPGRLVFLQIMCFRLYSKILILFPFTTRHMAWLAYILGGLPCIVILFIYLFIYLFPFWQVGSLHLPCNSLLVVSNCVNTKKQITDSRFSSGDWNNNSLNLRLFKTMDYSHEPQLCSFVKQVESRLFWKTVCRSNGCALGILLNRENKLEPDWIYLPIRKVTKLFFFSG